MQFLSRYLGRWPIALASVVVLAAVVLLPGLGRFGLWEPQERQLADKVAPGPELAKKQATGVPPEEHREHEGWSDRLRALFEAQVLIYLQHPWILSLPITGTPITPNSSAWIDAGLEALAATPLDENEKLAVTLAGTGHARWYGMVLAGYAETSRSTGMDADEVATREATLFDRVVTAEEFPHLRAAIDAGVFTAPDDPFRFGFDRLLDGVALYIERLEQGGARATVQEWIAVDPADLVGDKKYREAQKAVRDAEKALRAARKIERLVRREALARAARGRGES